MKTFREELEEKLSKAELEDKPMKFKITIEEHVSQTFEVEATDIEEAMEIAERNYNDGYLVVDNGNLVAKQMMAECDEDGETTEWVEF
jgi:hypothetical protein